MNEVPDRLLRGALVDAASTEASEVCVDADALAAWADGTMSGAARAAFEAHAAGCLRCQALMAAMARTEPPPIDAAWWRRSPFSWLMPLAAATAAVVIVVNLTRVERNAPALSMAAPVKSKASSSAAAPAVREEPAGSAAPAAQPRMREELRTADARREESAPADKARALSPATAKASPGAAPAAQAAPKAEAPAQDAAVAQPPAPAPAPTPAPSLSAAAAPTATADAQERRASPPAAAAAGAAATRLDLHRSENAASREQAFRSLEMKTAIAMPLTVIASPDRDAQWRIVNGAVERTGDGGRTWQPQSLGVSVPVRAGAAPAARVCWLVGARGLVLLTTDAVHWRLIAFPEPVDLLAIQSTGELGATVTTTDARRFTTADGGKTWSQK